ARAREPSRLAARRAEHRSARKRALVRLSVDRDLRAQPSGVDVLHVLDDGQDAADADAVPADLLLAGRDPVSSRSRPVLDDDEPVDGGTGPDHAAAGAEACTRGEALVADAAEARRFR